MKKLLLWVVALLMVTVPLRAQQLNIGVAGRRFSDTPVLDAVLMKQVSTMYVYGQATVTKTNKKPELSLALEIPAIETKHFYLGIDEGVYVGVTENNKFDKGVMFVGLTSWMPVTKTAGFYFMASQSPAMKWAPIIQAGLFKQIF